MLYALHSGLGSSGNRLLPGVRKMLGHLPRSLRMKRFDSLDETSELAREQNNATAREDVFDNNSYLQSWAYGTGGGG